MKYGAIIVENRTMVNMQDIYAKHVPFLPSNFEVMHFERFPIGSAVDYNRLMTDADFWRAIPFDKILVFQHDSQLLRKGLEEFMEYDFIGAPLYHIPMPAMNGGLSLRSKNKMIEICEKFPYQGIGVHGNEDIYFCNHMEKVGGKLPDKETAQKFCVETILGYGSLGIHAIDKWHNPQAVEAIVTQYHDKTIKKEFDKACQGGDISQHMHTIKDYAKQCNHVTEFGPGNSTWAFLEAGVKELHLYDLEEKESLHYIVKAARETKINFHMVNVLKTQISKTELLLIDTYGCYSQLSAELARHAALVMKYIIIHDTVTWGHQNEIGGYLSKAILEGYKENDRKGLIPAIHHFLVANPAWSVEKHLLNNNGLTILSRRKVVRKLYTSLYQEKHPDRQKEYYKCLSHNIANPLIEKIYVIADQNYPELQHRKVVPIISADRPKYNTFFSLINETIGDDEIAIISNTDIHFNKTLGLISHLPNTCVALSRWEGDDLHHERYSQDVWMFQGKIKPGMYGDFYLGIRGCDNRIAFEIKKVGYNIINPSQSVQCMHVHKSAVRNYGIEKVPMPYLPVEIREYIY